MGLESQTFRLGRDSVTSETIGSKDQILQRADTRFSRAAEAGGGGFHGFPICIGDF